MIYAIIVAAGWIAFLAYWLVSSFRVKDDLTRRRALWIPLAARILAALVVILALRLPAVRAMLRSSRGVFSFSHPGVGIAGSVLCVAGVGLAIWARSCLGSNWSPRPSAKVGHELVTSGPYRLVRHPIYTGMLVALLGTTLDAGAIGIVVFLFAAAILISRVPVEERLMLRLFPEQYPQYRNRTKALIPYVV